MALTAAMGAGPATVFAFSVFAPVLRSDLGVSQSQIGLLVSCSFAVAAAMAVQGGRWVDRHGGSRMLVVVYASAAAALALFGLARSALMLAVAAVGAGFAQAISHSATNVMIMDYAEGRLAGLLVGIKQSGVQLSQFLVGLTLPAIAVLWSWRAGIAVALAWVLFGWAFTSLLPPADSTTKASRRERSAERVPLPPGTVWLTGVAMVAGALALGVNSYLPSFGHDMLGMEVAVAGLSLAVVGGVGIVSRIVLSSIVADLRRPRMAIGLLYAVACLALLLFSLSPRAGQWMFWVAAVIFAFSAVAANGAITYMVVAAGSPAGGRASGWVATGLYLGFTAGPALFGGLLALPASYSAAWAGIGSVAVLGVIVCLVWSVTAGEVAAIVRPR